MSENSMNISKRAGALTALTLTTLALLVSGCTGVRTSDRAVCDGVGRFLDRHADALLSPDVPDDVVVTGASLIASIDAACGV
jgi:hypothetical protein